MIIGRCDQAPREYNAHHALSFNRDRSGAIAEAAAAAESIHRPAGTTAAAAGRSLLIERINLTPIHDWCDVWCLSVHITTMALYRLQAYITLKRIGGIVV